MEPWIDGSISKLELLYLPELENAAWEWWGALILKLELLYHPELRGWSLGLMGPDSQNTNSSISLNSENRAWMGRPWYYKQNSYISRWTHRTEPGSDGAPLILKSRLLYHPELKGWRLRLVGGPDSQNQTYHLELRGCSLRLVGRLSCDLELCGWGLGLLARPCLLLCHPELRA